MKRPRILRGWRKARVHRYVLAVEDAVRCWWKRSSRQAGALTYTMLQSMAPLLVLAVAVAGQWFGRDAVLAAAQAQVELAVGKQGAAVIKELVAQARDPMATATASLLVLGWTVWSASRVFASLQESLDEIFCEPLDATRRRGRRLRSALRESVLHFAMVPATGFLLCVVLAASPVLTFLTAAVGWDVPAWVLLAIPAAVTACAIAAVFWVLPTAPKRAPFLWTGVIAATVLCSVVGRLFDRFLNWLPPASAYGAASSLVVLLLCVYWSARMVFLAAELAEASAKYCGAPHRVCVAAPACSGEGSEGCARAHARRP
ncbi:MAG: YihY/virulence factor BrkB family protein [Myxococcales bacterium]|nr:YihY/virulence factor BrkB family protein [Myxococcales bacterium]